jgi:hypothetical protein
MKRLVVALLLLAPSLSFAAQPQMPVKEMPAQFATDTITCPERLEGWPYEVINLKECSYPVLSIKETCVKWNNKQISVPSGWEYDDNGRYSSASHVRSSHFISQAGNKTYLHCAYAVGTSTNTYITHIIRREAPSGKACKKSDGFSFRCESTLPKQLPR